MPTANSPVARQLSIRAVPPARLTGGLEADVRAGLLAPPRWLPPRHFYDDRGSRLFDAICDTPEYYPTRTEAALLERHAGELVGMAGPDHIIEFGSGACRKTRHLLKACREQNRVVCFWPFDVCRSMVEETARELVEDYPGLTVHGLVGDYLAGLDHLPDPDGRRLFVFLGSTIGNFTADEAQAFLSEVRSRMQAGDSLLLGADRVKSTAVLHAAYNDAAGLTAEFNLNLLRVLNRELGADFDLSGFEHLAHYDQARQQIEMYLVARHRQRVQLARMDCALELAPGERILTEISRKFHPADLDRLLAGAGFRTRRHFEPENGHFSLVMAAPA